MNFINKVNKYLIERYPTIWNTKIVWMLSISLLIHLLFFVIGYQSHSNPVSMQKSFVLDDYYSSGMILVQIIISKLLLVGWLVYMFKNNAFKNFYPTSNLKLFGQFISYAVIIFVSITFYFSYMLGFQMHIKSAYPDEQLQKNVAIINKAYPFLSINYQEYQVNKRAYPTELKALFCESNKEVINWDKPYFKNRDDVFQFYSIYKVGVTQRDSNGDFKYPVQEYKNNTPLAYQHIKNDTCFYYFKKDVVDVSAYIKSAELSYYNFSKLFYTLNNPTNNFNSEYNSYAYTPNNESMYNYNDALKNFDQNKEVVQLLDRKNPDEFKKIFNDFLQVSSTYKIQTNLTTENWFKMVYQPDTFQVKHFISTNANLQGYEYVPQQQVYDTITAVTTTTHNNETNVTNAAAVKVHANKYNTNYNYYNRNLSKTYYEVNNLKNLLLNVELVKSTNVFEKTIHVYLWIAFFLATFVFSYRVTNLRAVIFAAVTVAILSLVIGLTVVVFAMGLGFNEGYFASYLVFTIATIILLLPILFLKRLPKLAASVFVNISITGFALYVFLILGIISMHQHDTCYDENSNKLYGCITLLETLDIYTSYILLLAGIVFIYFYTAVIKRWRALPE